MKAEYDFSKAKRGAVKSPAGKTRITIYLDDDLLEHFREVATREGLGYQTVINRTLRAAMAGVQVSAGRETADASALLVEIRDTLNEVKERLQESVGGHGPNKRQVHAGGTVAPRQGKTAVSARRGEGARAVESDAAASSSNEVSPSGKRRAASKGTYLSVEVADRMLHLIATDDAFRQLFTSSPSAALRLAGAAASHADALVAMGNMQVAQLASKEEIRAAHNEILGFLTSIEFTPAHASAVVLCFEAEAARLRAKKRQTRLRGGGDAELDGSPQSPKQRRR